MVGTENAANYKTFIYLAASASAEVIADVALCPMEAVKVGVQTLRSILRVLLGSTKAWFLFGGV